MDIDTRQWFAGLAMQALIAQEPARREAIATMAFSIADDMMDASYATASARAASDDPAPQEESVPNNDQTTKRVDMITHAIKEWLVHGGQEQRPYIFGWDGHGPTPDVLGVDGNINVRDLARAVDGAIVAFVAFDMGRG